MELSNRFGASAHTGELEMFVWPLKIAHLSSSGGELPPEVAKWFTGIAHRFLDQFIGEYTMALRGLWQSGSALMLLVTLDLV